MALNIYLNFKGNALEVIRYYQNIFSAPEPEIMYFKDIPPSEQFPVTKEIEQMVMHGELKINEAYMMFSDVPPNNPQQVDFGNNMSIMYSSKDFDELKALYEKMSQEGNIIMPFQSTFWSKGYGMLVDKFGICWQFNCNSND
ncbi:MAG: VOC family protein [Clostridia bacterium]|nr:VOC family protein [Clostridia bacterium]